jgi:hypothetical protein
MKFLKKVPGSDQAGIEVAYYEIYVNLLLLLNGSQDLRNMQSRPENASWHSPDGRSFLCSGAAADEAARYLHFIRRNRGYLAS